MKSDLPVDCYDFVYRVSTRLHLTLEEVQVMAMCAERHYDFKCKETVAKADGHGRLNGILTMILFRLQEESDATECELTQNQIDTLLKVLEMAPMVTVLAKALDQELLGNLIKKLRQCFNAINDEGARLRGQSCNYIFNHLS